MPILNIATYPPGLVGVNPSIVYLDTNDTLAEVTATGYLNKAVQQGFVFNESMMACVSTKTTPNATSTQVAWLEVSKSGSDWSLVANNSEINLPNGQIFVGNSMNVASGVAMSGDATIDNTGLLTVVNSAIITAKLANNAVTSAKADQRLIRYLAVPMTAAQFNGMYAAPFQLIAAAGANQLIVIERVCLVMTYGTTAFAAGGVVALQYGNTVHGAGPLATNTEAATDFTATVSTSFMFNGNSGDTVGAVPFSTSVNTPIYISNQTGAFTTGDSTFVAQVWYKVVPTA